MHQQELLKGNTETLLLALLLMMLSPPAFLLDPAVLESQIANRAPSPSAADSNGEVTTRWSDNVT